MSKSDKPLEYIDTSSAKNPLGNGTFAEGKSINGLDTETADGDVFAIGCHYGDTGEYVSKVGEEKPLSGTEILEFLTSGGMRGSLNMWYNLNFDANVILKGLPDSRIEDIKVTNSTTWETNGKEFEISYIPKKMLKLRVNKNRYAHYDASQFTYSGGLESAAEDWLGIESGKLNEDIDPAKFGKLVGPLRDGQERPLNNYTTDNMTKIKDYLQQDCKLTSDIYQVIVDTAENELETPVPMGSPYSTGYVAADFIRERLEEKPIYSRSRVQAAAWKAYHGGRFEVTKRGDVGRVYGPDINSAYPAVMSELPDPGTLDWYSFSDDSGRGQPIAEANIEEADYGFLKVRMTTDPKRPIQPFAVKNPASDRVEYPAIHRKTLWVLKDTFQYALAEGFLTDYEIKRAELGYETEETEFPFAFFKELYAKRKRLEAEGRDKPAKLLKIVMNSMYGKTCQTNLRLIDAIEEAPDIDGIDVTEEDIEEAGGFPVNKKPDGMKLVYGPSGKPYLEYSASGKLFNPFLAAYITGRTRLDLLRGVVDNGLEDNTVMLATDSLMVEADAFESSGLYDKAEAEPDDPADALGGWDYDYVGDGFVIGSGLYQVDRTDKDDTKLGTRGFKDIHSDENDFDTLTEAAQMYPDGVPVTTERPLTFGDLLHTGKSLTKIGVFTKSKRMLSADMDDKRSWENDSPTFPDLLSGTEQSLPKLDKEGYHGLETQDL